MNLHSKFRDLEGRDEYIAESLDITKEEARQLIKSSSFKDYLNLVEANADKGNVGTQTTQSSMTGDQEASANTPRKPKDASTSTAPSADDQSDFDAAIKQFDSPTDKNELKRIQDLVATDPDAAMKELEKFSEKNPTVANDDNSAYDKFKQSLMKVAGAAGSTSGKFKQGLQKGLQEAQELERIRELAGLINETATDGSTSSGNVASMPSVVGNTSDSHKPSVKLRHQMRLDREEEEKEDARKERQKEKEQESESDIERLIKR